MRDQLLNKWLEINHTCPLCDIHPAINAGPCKACSADLPVLLQCCPRCALPGSKGLCPHCAEREPSYRAVFGALNYRFPIPQLIHRIKTGRDPEPLHWLSRLLADRMGDQISPSTTLIPVPMHPWDQTLRGFNQSDILSANLAKQLNLRRDTQLVRKTERTAHQASLSRSERRDNLHRCYQLTASVPAHVTLVDDVMTTGTTVERLSDLLLEAGCADVEVCVLCRTPE
jgi:ComF family protein